MSVRRLILALTLASAPLLEANAVVAPKAPSLPPNALIKVDVIGEDQRVAVPDRHIKTAESIGLVWQRGSGHACSAFCVGDSVIATNAHCIVRIDGREAKNLQLFRFVLAPEVGLVTTDHISTLLFAATDQPNLSFFAGDWRSQRSLNAMEQDWAFAKLAKPICRGKALAFAGAAKPDLAEISPPAEPSTPYDATAEQRRSDRLFMIAYHGDRNLEQRWYSGDCERRPSRRQALMFHTCDTFKGSSGAPVMRMRNGVPEVVAINAGTYAQERYRYSRYRTRSGRVRRQRQIISKSVVNVGIKPHGFVAGLQRFRREYLLSSLNAFKDVQIRLQAGSYYRGRIDGIFGRRTRRAIVEFERARGLEPIGMPTQRLLNELKDKRVVPASEPTAQSLRQPGS